jgi:hypothetical protein
VNHRPIPAYRAGRPRLAPVWGALLALVSAIAAASCGRRSAEPDRSVSIPVDVSGDTSRSITLPIAPRTRALARLERVRPAPPLGIGPSLPDATPDSAPPASPSVAASGDNRLKPPILRTPGRLILPIASARAIRSRGLGIDLDLRVDESGAVTEATWAGGVADSALIAAARRWALEMRFYPALMGGKPIAVWCRQRLELSRSD